MLYWLFRISLVLAEQTRAGWKQILHLTTRNETTVFEKEFSLNATRVGLML